MVQWWERSPPTNVSRVRFPDTALYVGWVCCWFSTLLREVFLRVLRFSPLLKKQHFQIPIRSWNARTFLNEFLWTPWCSVGKQITFYSFFTFTRRCLSLWAMLGLKILAHFYLLSLACFLAFSAAAHSRFFVWGSQTMLTWHFKNASFGPPPNLHKCISLVEVYRFKQCLG